MFYSLRELRRRALQANLVSAQSALDVVRVLHEKDREPTDKELQLLADLLDSVSQGIKTELKQRKFVSPFEAYHIKTWWESRMAKRR